MLYLMKFVYQWLLPPACIFLPLLGLAVYMQRKQMRLCAHWSRGMYRRR